VGAACVVIDRVGSMCLWIGALARLPTSVGVDKYLPARFTSLHPVYATPAFAIWTQAIIVVLLVILGQSGTSVRGAYNVLIEMMIVSSLAPFLFLFGAAIKLSANRDLIAKSRIPGGRPLVVLVALLGLVTCVVSMVISFIPPPDEEHPTLAVIKIAGLTAILLLGGAALYLKGRSRIENRAASMAKA
jgi:amino acid transporter